MGQPKLLDIPIIISDGAKKPTKAHPYDAGWDLYAYKIEQKRTANHAILLVDCGVKFAIPNGWCGILYGRSGLAVKNNLVTRTYGVIDSGYQGNVLVLLEWDPLDPMSVLQVKPGDRIAQILFFEVPLITMPQLSEFPNKTPRGKSGFGSSGV